MREQVSRGLAAEGREDKASLAAQRELTTIEELPGSPAPGWRLLRFDAVPHAAASFCVAYSPRDQVFYLTESPLRFAAFARAAGVAVTNPDEAVVVGLAFLATTRSMGAYERVVASVDELDVLGEPDAGDRRRLDAARDRLRPVLREPYATVTASGHVVTVHVQRGPAVERRTLVVAADGAVAASAETVVDDLPAPISL